MRKPSKKRTLFLIILFLLSLFLSLPREVPVNIQTRLFKINSTYNLPAVNLNLGPISFTRSLDLKLGLDLAGGSKLIFELDLSQTPFLDRQSAVEATRATVARRVNLFGVSESTVKTAKVEDSERVIVELPGVYDTKEAEGLIGKTAKLDFWLIKDTDEKDESRGKTVLGTGLTGADLERAKIEFDPQTGKPVVGIEFNKTGAEKFRNITKDNVGFPLAIALDQNIVTQPVVQQEISEGKAVITGEFTIEEARELSIQLNSGALPAPLKLIEQRTVGATLGKKSVEQSVIAGIIGLGLVAFFMITYYQNLGMIATLALFLYGLLTVSLYKLIPVVLTLPGIAGFVLSIGMAVDTNILIFERIKEEKMAGKPVLDAVENGFARALTSIKDANIATLFIVAVLLNPFEFPFLHTEGPVRGFAVTLGIGVILSLFTGLFVTQTLVKMFIKK